MLMKKTYSVKQLADALGFSTNTVYKYLLEGKIKATRLGKVGRFRIKEEEVMRLIGLKGEKPQIASRLSPSGAVTFSADEGIIQESTKVGDYEDNLALLTKISNPDLFDWFLSLTAIFLGISYFLFPLHYQYISIEPYRIWVMVIKFALIGLGITLMVTDVFLPVKKFHHHIIIRVPLILAFAGLSAIIYLTGEHWSATYFLSLAVFTFLPIFWSKGAFFKFTGFVYFLVLVSGFVWARDPQVFVFADIRDFVYAFPGIFEIILTAGASIFFILVIFTYYKSQALLFLLSWVLSVLFFLLSISFINDQSWNKAVVTLMIGSFGLVIPFHKEFDTLSKFSRKDVIISFSWIVLILVVGVAVIFYTQNTFKSFVVEESQKKVETGAKLVDSFMQDTIMFVDIIAQAPALLDLLDSKKISKDKLEDIIKSEYQGSTTLKRLVIFDSNGNVLALYPPGDFKMLQDNFAAQEYFKRAKEYKATAVSELIVSKTDKDQGSIVVAAPILDINGEVKGVIGGGIDISELEDKLSVINFNDGGSFVLADNNTNIFIHEDKDLIGTLAELNTALVRGVEGYSGSIEGYSENGILSLQTYSHIPKVSWGIVVQQPISEAFRESSLVSLTIFLITILSGVGALLVTIYLKKRRI